jgi:hypothetical protein
VDWCGGSYFEFFEPAWTNLLRFAREQGKPVGIWEATPQGYDISRCTVASTTGNGEDQKAVTSKKIWAWYDAFFRYCHANNDVIKAIAYISCGWRFQKMWCAGAGTGWWGDSRVNTNPVILQRWVAEIDRPNVWLQASPDLVVRLNN